MDYLISKFKENKWLFVNKLILGLILLTPLVVHELFLNPFAVPRAVYFRILVEILLVVYVILSYKFPKYRPKWRHPVVISVLVFFGALCLSLFTGVQFFRGFWGTVQRGGGVFQWAHVVTFFIILTAVLRTKKDWIPFVYLMSGVQLVVALYAIAQKLGLGVLESGVDRVVGTIGNAALMAGFLIFGFYLFLYLFLQAKRLWVRIYCVSGIFITFSVIAFSKTRSAMIGMVISIVFLLFYSAISKQVKKNHRVVALSVLLFIIVFVGTLFLFKDSAAVKSVPLFKRFTSLDVSATTAQTRFYDWRGGFRAWQDRPIFGWGVENYNIAYNKYFDAGFYEYSKGETWIDRAHNTPIEFLTTTGIVGLLSYLTIFFVIAFVIFYGKKKKYLSQNESAVFLSVFIAYFVHNLLVFDSINSWLALFFVIALIVGCVPFKYKNFVKKDFKNSFLMQIIIVFLIIIFSFLTFRIHIPLLKSSLEGRDVLQQLVDTRYDLDSVLNKMQLSLSRDLPWNWEFVSSHYGKSLMDIVRDRQYTEGGKEKIINSLKFVVQILEEADDPPLQDAKAYQRFARIYTLLVELDPENTSYQEKAFHYLNIGLEIGPNRLPTMYVLAQLYAYTDDFEKAISVLDEAVEIYPAMPETYWSRALVFSKKGEGELVIENVKKAIDYKYSFRSLHDINTVLPVFQEKKDYDSLEYLFKQAIRFDKNNPQWYANLAAVYKEKGEKERAMETLVKILDISPAFIEQVRAFQETL